MGEDKSTLALKGKTSIERVTSVLSVIAPNLVISQSELHPVYPVIPDIFLDAGPLGGLHAVMKKRNESWFVVSACDTPFINQEVYEHLLSYRGEQTDAIIPIHEGRLHPLSGIYHKRTLPILECYLSNGGRRVQGFLDQIQTVTVESISNTGGRTSHFFNMNTQLDYKEAKEWVEKVRR